MTSQVVTAHEGTVHGGVDVVAIPGPSILPDRIREAMARPMPNIYAGEILDVSADVLKRLPAVARTAGHPFIITSNGHGAWQMAISNTLQAGDKVLVLESGRFAVVWGSNAALAGLEVEVLEGDFFSPVDPEAVAARLAIDDGSIRAILVSHTDTSSSVRNDIQAIRSAIDSVGHDALLMVDCIASMGAEPFEMDTWGVDLALAASQKGLMCPPGLGLLWAGERALEVYRSLPRDRPRVGYVDWERRLAPVGFYDTYAGTPPVAHLRALDVALSMIEEEGGLDAVWRRHERLAKAVHAAVDAWSAPGGLSLNITSPAHRSNAVTTIQTGEIDSIELTELCKNQMGVTLGIGMAVMPDRSFRIGHMGHINEPMLLGTLGVIEAALVSMSAPMGDSGVRAAAAMLAP